MANSSLSELGLCIYNISQDSEASSCHKNHISNPYFPIVSPIQFLSNTCPIVPILPLQSISFCHQLFGGSKPNNLSNKKKLSCTHNHPRHINQTSRGPVRVQYHVHGPVVHHSSPVVVVLGHMGVIHPPAASDPDGGALTLPSFPMFLLT